MDFLFVSDIQALKYFINITERLLFVTIMLCGYLKLWITVWSIFETKLLFNAMMLIF